MTIFLSPGVPLFKAAGVPAFGLACCCGEGPGICDFCGSLGTWNYLRIYMEWDSDTIGFGCPYWNGLMYFGFIDTLAPGPGCEWTSLPINCEDFLEPFPNITINYDGNFGNVQVTMNLASDDSVSGLTFNTCPPTTTVFYDSNLGVTITIEYLTL